MHIKLYQALCPKIVEKFTAHCQNGFYAKHLFHHLIRGCMIHTGDPLGDGTGGNEFGAWNSRTSFIKGKSFFTIMPALSLAVF